MLRLRVCLLSCLLIGRPALADDAYDDEAVEETRPPPRDRPTEEEPDAVGAGGLTAPGALVESEDERSDIEKELEEADRRDSGRGLEFVWLYADLGFSTVDLNALSENSGLLDDTSSSGGSGFLYGGAGGVRFLYFTLGARFRLVSMADMRLWSLAAEAGLKVPFGNLEPYFSLGLGYLAVGEYTATTGVNASDIDGFDLRATGGVDYYLGNYFSIGAAVSGDLLFLGRPADVDSGVAGAKGTGAQFAASAILGFHF